MDTLPHFFCAKCGEVVQNGFTNISQRDIVIDGKHYHLDCSQDAANKWVDKKIIELDILLAKKRLKKNISKK